MKLHHVQISIPIGSENVCRHFYGEILSFKEIEKPENLKKRGGVWYQLGDIEIHFGAEDIEHVSSRRHVAVSVDNLEKMSKKLVASGIDIEEDANPIPNWKRFYCLDPFNNRIEFLSLD